MSKTHKQRVEKDNLAVDIVLTQVDKGWQMMIVDDEGIATSWEDIFDDKASALAEAKAAIDEQGIQFFVGVGY